MAEAVGSAAAIAIDERRRRRFDLGVGERITRQDRVHPADGLFDDIARRRVHLDRRHQRLIEAQIDRVELALARAEFPVRREHPRDVGLVVLVVGRVIELHQIAVLQLRGVLVVVRVERVRAGRNEREIRSAVGAELLEDELRVGLQFVFVQARPGVAHRLHDAEAGDAGGLADDRDLTRAFGDAQRVEDRIEVLDLGLRRRRLQLRDERLLARDPSVPRVLPRRAPERCRIAR